MAFGRGIIHKRHIGLMSLIDVIFLLLIFFLVVSVFINAEQSEYSIQVPTPKVGQGDANILIQITDDGQFLFMDRDYFKRMDRFLAGINFNWEAEDAENLNYKSTQFQQLLKTIASGETRFGYNENRIPSSLSLSTENEMVAKLQEKISISTREDERFGRMLNYIVLVRCPSAIPYGAALRVVDLIQGADDARELFTYGLSGGSLQDFTDGGAVRFEKNGALPSELVIVFGNLRK